MGYIGKLPSRYEPKKIEEEVLEFWDKSRVYEKLRAMLKDAPKFYFLDGPPYPSSDIPHVGGVWNKVAKDAIIRYRRARGYRVNDTPGYDCHGLPIEVKVEQRLGFRSKKDIEEYGIDRFIEECKKFAFENLQKMSEHFKNMGVSMDWERPYLTLNNDYIQSAWWLIKLVHDRGLLRRGIKVLHWCPRCETVLADYEVSEYRDIEDPSIYVKFPVKDHERLFIVIWTTTPWTLPANVAVMVHPDFDYAFVRKGNEVLIVLKDRLPEVIEGEYKVEKVVKGRELEGLEYIHPLREEVKVQMKLGGIHRVVLSSEYVRAEEGTGCVHIAPGHGEEDFEVGMEYKLPVVCPVDSKGMFTEEAGKYAGMYVRDSNKYIIQDLDRKGLLLKATTIVHKYPVCWRCKTPLIFRATEQWFIRIKHLKDKFIKEAERVRWIPEWAGAHRFRNWLEGLRDWVISRQRYWGIPLPIWVCKNCGATIAIGSLEELKKKAKKEVELPDLHRPWVDHVVLECDKCGGEMRRVPDVLDVWFDSGIAFYASLGYPLKVDEFKRMWPVDFIIEGHDQIAGWFFSLLRTGILGFSRTPYTTVLMHGFALDEKGREMHKSLGNYITPQEVLARKRGSRDVLRWYLLRNTTWEDLRFSWRSLDQVFDDLNIVWNVYLFASTYMNLDRFEPDKHRLEDYMHLLRPEDRWLISRVERLTEKVTNALDNYLVHIAARALRDFIVEDVSHWYIRLIRRRVWIEKEDPEKITAYVTLYYALRKFLVLAAPIIPFIVEKIYREAFKTSPEMPESVHMLPWPELRRDLINDELEKYMEIVREIVEKGSAARMVAGIKIRQPLPTLYILTDDEYTRLACTELIEVIKSQVNVKSVEILPSESIRRFIKYSIKPVYSVIGPHFKRDTKEVLRALQAIEPKKVVESMKREGTLSLKLSDGRTVQLTKDMLEITEEPIEGFVLKDFRRGIVVLYAKVGREELLEGIAKDIIRRVQFMRKEMELAVDAFIEVKIYTTDEDLVEAIERYRDYIMGEVRAKILEIVKEPSKVTGRHIRDWTIDKYSVCIGVSELLL
ncbi:MAG: isoleucine--tRNA ligase [Thermoprotei archaeon]|nr:MAG: isoleucine--tRNA ligase [Thermoprotei archaeon]